MTESNLIYLLFLLTSARLLIFLRPRTLAHLGLVSAQKVKEIIDSVVWAGVVALFLIHFVVRSFYIPSGSMLPTLNVNDFILVNEMLYDFTKPVRGDIVVFRPPVEENDEETDLIKRVVAVENDVVELRDGRIYINDQPIQEEFILEPMEGEYGPERIKKDHIFVMGDNRNDSRDSRYIGQIPLKNLVGRAEMVFFPPARIKLFNFPRRTVVSRRYG